MISSESTLGEGALEGPTKRQATAVAVASIVAAGSNFFLMYVGTRTLSSHDGTEFLAFWSLLTGVFGVVSGVQNEVTRGVGQVARGRVRGVRAVLPAIVAGLIAAAGVGALSPLIALRILPLSASSVIPVLLVTTVLYAVYVSLVGSLAGRSWWSEYAGVLAGEVIVRMGLLLVVFLGGASLVCYEVAACAATAVVLLSLAFSRRCRLALGSRTDRGLMASLPKYLLAMMSTTGTAVLITAYGAILKAVAGETDPVELGGLILSVSLTRAPIMIPLTAFTGVAISYFLRHRDHPLRSMSRPAGLLLGLGLLGGGLAWFVGPWIAGIFNPDYRVPAWVLGCLTFSSALVAILTLLGTVALALDDHLAYALGWVLAAVTAVGVLLVPGNLAIRVVCSMFFGPLVGSLGLLVRSVVVTRQLGAGVVPIARGESR